MNEEIDIILDSTDEAMQAALAHLDKSLSNIRAGKASPQMLGSVFVDYYGFTNSFESGGKCKCS
ncbi:hypothetical protein CCAN2_2040078 [Capnocytophaga canimorsus]|nr:hypothetical protein CCAN2_2040078 [Capnocytophaga canimorsus]